MHNVDIALTKPQREFCFSNAQHTALVAGLGCMRASTKVVTRNGLKCISEIKAGDDVLSWNEIDQKFQLSPTSGAYLKGKGKLYRVVTKRGEWFASEHHRTLCADGKYRLLGELNRGDLILTASLFQLSTSSELDRIWSPSNDRHYWKKHVDYLGCCELSKSLYGQQLHKALNNALAFSPLQDDAHKYYQNSFYKGDFLGQKLEHIHQDQSYDRQPKQDYLFRVEELGASEASQVPSLFAGYIYELIQSYLKAPLMSVSRLQVSLIYQSLADFLVRVFFCSKGYEAELADQARGYFYEPKVCLCLAPMKDLYTSFSRRVKMLISSLSHSCYNSTSNTNKDSIIHIEQLNVEEDYYDMHVAGNNNYVTEDGAIHHNSGKSRAATMRLILLLIEEEGLNAVYGMPSYDLLRLRAIPGVEEDLNTMGLEYTLNKSTFTIKIHGYGDIIFRSYDRPESWIAFECAHGVLDELDVLSKEKAAFVWRKATERIRQNCKRGNTLSVVTTPDSGINGFIYEKWVKKKQDGYELIKASTLSNPFLPDGYIDQIRANYDPVLADMYINGEFVSLTENKVYHFFNRQKHHTDRVINEDDKFLYIGIDFNIGGCCAVVAVSENNKAVFVDEFVSHDTYDFVNNLTRYAGHTLIIYPDSTGKSNRTNATSSDIAIIENAGYICEYDSNNPAIRDRINSVNALLSHDRMLVNSDKCPELAHALETQGYVKGEPEKFTEHPAIDDYADSLGYIIHGRWPVNFIRTPKTKGFY